MAERSTHRSSHSFQGQAARISIMPSRPSLRFVIALLFLAAPAVAQFSQQGTKLVGTGVEPFTHAEQGRSVAVSSDGNTMIVGGIMDGFGLGAAWIWTKAGAT